MKISEARFDLGDVLSVTTGKLVSPEGIGGVYKILNYLTGDNLMTHQLPRACEAMAPEVLRQHEYLSEISGDEVTAENHKQWLAEMKSKYGDTIPLISAPGLWKRKDPIQELSEMVGPERVAVIQAGTEK